MPADTGEQIQLQVSSVGTFNELKQSAISVFIITLYQPKVGCEESLCSLVPPGGPAHKDSLNLGPAVTAKPSSKQMLPYTEKCVLYRTVCEGMMGNK